MAETRRGRLRKGQPIQKKLLASEFGHTAAVPPQRNVLDFSQRGKGQSTNSTRTDGKKIRDKKKKNDAGTERQNMKPKKEKATGKPATLKRKWKRGWGLAGGKQSDSSI